MASKKEVISKARDTGGASQSKMATSAALPEKQRKKIRVRRKKEKTPSEPIVCMIIFLLMFYQDGIHQYIYQLKKTSNQPMLRSRVNVFQLACCTSLR
jgi:hypothetical protein